jgi:outer membrane biosynthesis protein TonB
MKLLRLKTAIVVVMLVLGISGCSQKKPVLVAPQQPPPIMAPQPTPTPEPEAASQPAEQPQETQPATTTEKSTTAAKSKPKSSKSSTTKKPATTSSTGNEVARNNTKIVVPADKTVTPTTPAAGQISPGPTPSDATHNQSSTEQLLRSAEENLNSIKRQLSKDEEAMRAQIREFISQSHKATTENDLARAHNFAVKARLLSDELVKPQ